MISLEENPTINLHDEVEKQDLHSILCQTKNDELKKKIIIIIKIKNDESKNNPWNVSIRNKNKLIDELQIHSLLEFRFSRWKKVYLVLKDLKIQSESWKMLYPINKFYLMK